MIKILALPLRKTGVDKKSLFFFAYASSSLIKAAAKTESLSHKLLQKAINHWDNLGSSPDGSIKKRMYNAAVAVTNRFHRDEWMLKDFAEYHDHLLPNKPSANGDSDNSDQLDKKFSIDILHTASTSPDLIWERLAEIERERRDFHPRMYTLSLCCIPLSIAAGIIPGPNFFLAYNLFRVYSHNRASKGLQVLRTILDHSKDGNDNVNQNIIVKFEENLDLDRLLGKIPSKVSSSPAESDSYATRVKDSELINDQDIAAIQEHFNLPKQHFQREISRAIIQLNKG